MAKTQQAPVIYSFEAIRGVAGSHVAEAIDTAVEVMRDQTAMHSARIRAAEMLMSYGIGKPAYQLTPIPAIEGLDLSTEGKAVDSLKLLTTEMASGRLSIEHGAALSKMIVEVIAAERNMMEGQVKAALLKVQQALEHRSAITDESNRKTALEKLQ